MPAARMLSLDVVRGVMLVVSVGVDSLLAQPEWFGHAVWEGVHPVDLVFPVFVTLSGCGLAFAMHRRVRAWPLLRRVAILLAAGLVYNAIALNSWRFDDWWLTGVLQLYAGVVRCSGSCTSSRAPGGGGRSSPRSSRPGTPCCSRCGRADARGWFSHPSATRRGSSTRPSSGRSTPTTRVRWGTTPWGSSPCSERW
ncbi:heparan-alpha-glucosaminide N-acetyltransferase domain-containing protein [Herbiconiux sp. KACC 21604]|uniref:heparan-alpha-glucosaminide N-acetyltransferase domain-containing protein n=1 Tax=unclassified Herbiconiux TaxID=2618217 RepID=UPI0014908ECA|nr:heparan-alpha-glucosaminide N-acetyltransferase domain-containing protein [Herbiconiux sp. SALV-R1]QJU54558.1 DUF1624 domain-containing protein [Herbiconiux sp. SALV-R1]WPO85643.1 heparan-alpha-glucosaminide N-acetyltransferase domain-containing protein [Herbiconiux sp. KACC 21604]